MKKISVIVPTYNGEQYIERCINSIFSNTSKDFEAIIVDDGSTDNTLDILHKLEEKYDRLKIVEQTNKGVSAARNNGIAHSHGEYLMFCDCDDEYEKGLIDNIILNFNSNDDLIVFNRVDFQENKIVNFIDPTEKKLERKNIEEYLTKDYSKGRSTFSSCNKIYKRSIIEEHNLHFNESIHYSEDNLFNLIYLLFCKSVLKNYTTKYIRYCNNDSTVYKKINDYYSQNINVIEKFMEYLKLQNIDVIPYKEVINNLYYHYANVSIHRLITKMDCSSYKEYVSEMKKIRRDLKEKNIRFLKYDSVKDKLKYTLFFSNLYGILYAIYRCKGKAKRGEK